MHLALYTITKAITWKDINPIKYLRLKCGVLNLENLTIEKNVDKYFTYSLPICVDESEIKSIYDEKYDITNNIVYTLYRDRFDDENWNYLIDVFGTWLSPYNFKLIAFLIGPPDAGKSTLLKILSNPINPLVAWKSLSLISGRPD